MHLIATVTHFNSYIVELRLEGHSNPLRLTDRHRIFSVTRGDWTPAASLTPNEELQTVFGSARVASVTPLSGTQRVYNIEVETAHSYFAGEAMVLSHNVNPCAERTPWTSTDRRKAWKEKGRSDGKPPKREVIVKNRKTGEIETRVESKELHHDDPRRSGGSNTDDNLQEVWPDEHEAIDQHRDTGYDVIVEIPEHAYTDK